MAKKAPSKPKSKPKATAQAPTETLVKTASSKVNKKAATQGSPSGATKTKASSKGKASSKAAPSASSNTQRGSSTKPKLLSGGNPQIPKGDGDAPVQAYIAAIPGWQREVCVRLDALIERVVPHVNKAVRWNSAFYGVQGKGWFLSFHIFSRYVKVTFFAGGSLRPLPGGISKYAAIRYADVHEGELDERQMSSWVKQAAKLPGWSP